MCRRISTTGRWRHMALLGLLGVAVGGVVGFLFSDVGFGLLTGAVLGVLYGLLFSVRNPT